MFQLSIVDCKKRNENALCSMLGFISMFALSDHFVDFLRSLTILFLLGFFICLCILRVYLFMLLLMLLVVVIGVVFSRERA